MNAPERISEISAIPAPEPKKPVEKIEAHLVVPVEKTPEEIAEAKRARQQKKRARIVSQNAERSNKR